MKRCPECSREVVVTCSLRPDGWPNDQLYHACNYCTWEEKDLIVNQMLLRDYETKSRNSNDGV